MMKGKSSMPSTLPGMFSQSLELCPSWMEGRGHNAGETLRSTLNIAHLREGRLRILIHSAKGPVYSAMLRELSSQISAVDLLTFDRLEIYFKDSRSLLVVFASRKSRQDFSDKLTSSVSFHIHGPPRSPLVLKTPLLGMVGSRVLNGFKDEIGTAQRKWQAREISNVRELSHFLII